MKPILTTVTLLIVTAALSWPAVAQSEAEKKDEADRYELLVDHNIFLSNRRRPIERSALRRPREEPREAPKVQAPPPSWAPAPAIANFFVIQGIGMQGEECIAFMEDLRDNSRHQVKIGDPIADGVVVDMDIDSVLFEIDGEMRRIPISHTLTEKPVAVKYIQPVIVSTYANSSRSSYAERDSRYGSSSRYGDSRFGSRGGWGERGGWGDRGSWGERSRSGEDDRYGARDSRYSSSDRNRSDYGARGSSSPDLGDEDLARMVEEYRHRQEAANDTHSSDDDRSSGSSASRSGSSSNGSSNTPSGGDATSDADRQAIIERLRARRDGN